MGEHLTDGFRLVLGSRAGFGHPDLIFAEEPSHDGQRDLDLLRSEVAHGNYQRALTVLGAHPELIGVRPLAGALRDELLFQSTTAGHDAHETDLRAALRVFRLGDERVVDMLTEAENEIIGELARSFTPDTSEHLTSQISDLMYGRMRNLVSAMEGAPTSAVVDAVLCPGVSELNEDSVRLKYHLD